MRVARYGFAAFLFCVTASASFAAQNQKEAGVKVIIGDDTPLYRACFEQARDGNNKIEALEPCNRSLKEEPLTQRKRAIVHANRGVVYFNIGDYEAAVSDFTTTLDLGFNDRAKIYANRGLTHENLGFEALARADYKAALAIRDDHPLAKHRLEELSKPIYERSRIPRRITAEADETPLWRSPEI